MTTTAKKSKRVRKKPELRIEAEKAPGDFATIACELVAKHLRDKLALTTHDRDPDYWKFVFAHNVLLEVAGGRDPRKLIDRRKSLNSASSRAVDAVFRAMHNGTCRSMDEAYAIAAEELGEIDERNVKRYWSEHQATSGVKTVPPWMTLSRFLKRAQRRSASKS